MGTFLGADGVNHPDPENYTPAIGHILIAHLCQEKGVNAGPWHVDQAFAEYKTVHGRIPTPKDDFATVVKDWMDENPDPTPV